MEFTINAYTRDKEYDPIMLYLSKACDGTAPPGDHLNYNFVSAGSLMSIYYDICIAIK